MHTTIEDLTVYLVEPSPTQFAVISRELTTLGVKRIQQCMNGTEALAAMRQAIPSVLITSLYLPDMQGTDLIEAMRADADMERVPFILISSETCRRCSIPSVKAVLVPFSPSLFPRYSYKKLCMPRSTCSIPKAS